VDRPGLLSDPASEQDRAPEATAGSDPAEIDPVAGDPAPAALPQGPAQHRGGLVARVLGPVLVGLAVLVKVGGFGLKFFGIFLAVGGYALIWGLPFAVGVVLLILVHELGHYVEARRAGLDPQLPVFIPFLGAYVALRNMRFDPWTDARVSLAGPVAGGAAAFACLALGILGDSDLLLALAYAGFLLNLLNLIPLAILDGAHVLRAWRVLRAGGGRPTPGEARRLATVVAIASLATVAALVVGMLVSHVPQERL
jgi:Zn-dependent protease